MISKGEQVKNQFIVVVIVQFGEYGQYVIICDIVVQVGQNIVVIIYYFGLKDDLYFVCVQWIVDFIGDNFCLQVEVVEYLFVGEVLDCQVICDFIFSVCYNMILLFIQDDMVNLSKFIFCEQLVLIVVYYLIYQQVIVFLYYYFIWLIVVWIGCEVSDM